MKVEDAVRHAEHLCDVYPVDYAPDDFVGVIDGLRLEGGDWEAHVGGHPECPARWVAVERLATSCRVAS